MSYIEMADELLQNKLDNALYLRSKWKDHVISFLKDERNRVYIFGTGQVGQHFYHDMKLLGVHFQGFVDNDKEKWGVDICDGLRCMPSDKLREMKDIFVVVGVGMCSRDVFHQLQEMGIKNVLDATDFFLNFSFGDIQIYSLNDILEKLHKVFTMLADEESKKVLWRRLQGICEFEGKFESPHYFYDIYRENQYFPKDIVTITDTDVFVDCGAYTGDTLSEFLNHQKPFRKYIAYELSKINFDILKHNINNVQWGAGKIIAYNAGVGNNNEEIMYDEDISATAMGMGTTKGRIVRLADHLKNEHVTFIKMDIEGAEMEALRGAEELIVRCHPKLAICVYHKFSDLWEIPLYIQSLYPRYKIFLRHHTPLYLETVCYAIPT